MDDHQSYSLVMQVIKKRVSKAHDWGIVVSCDADFYTITFPYAHILTKKPPVIQWTTGGSYLLNLSNCLLKVISN